MSFEKNYGEREFRNLRYNIFSNPIKLVEPKWKNMGIANKKKALSFLKRYKWSSFAETIFEQKDKFSKIINKRLFLRLLGVKTEEEFEKFFEEWLNGN